MATPTFYGTQGNTKNTESQQNLQSLLGAGVPQDQISAYSTAQKGRIGTGDATNIYNAFSGTQAYSAGNITSADTTTASNPYDLLGIRNSINNDLGIPQMQTDYNNLYKQYSDYNTNALTRTNAYDQATDTGQVNTMNENKTIGVLRGEAAQQSAQRALGQSALARETQTGSSALKGQLDVLGNQLQMSTAEASSRYDIRANEVNDVKQLMLQFPDAGITFGDSTEKMASKVKDSNEKKTVTDMFTQTFGFFPTGLSLDAMNSKLAKKYKSTKDYTDAKQALELANAQSLITSRADSNVKTATDAATKQAADIDSYVKGLAGDVKAGNIPNRESARDMINAKYPGHGNEIYNYVSNDYQVTKQVPAGDNSVNLQHVTKTVTDILGGHTVSGTFNPATGEYKWDE
jgi:hypothetical protein